MSEPAAPIDPARLEELAAVTKEYATYSRSQFGLGAAIAGVWFVVAAGVLAAGSPGAGWTLVFLAPVFGMALVAVARGYYQRHGEVVEEEQEVMPNWGQPLGRGMGLSGVYMSAVVAIFWQVELASSGHEVGLFQIAVFVAWPVLALLLTRGTGDAFFAFQLCGPGALLGFLARDTAPGLAVVILVAANGLLLVPVGVRQHLRYRRLERRLAALRGRA